MKELASLFLPSNLAFVIFLVGGTACLWPKTRRFSRGLFMASGVIWLAFSLGPVAYWMIAPLEHEFPAMHDPSRHPGAERIVILSAYAADDPELPLSSRMNASATYRVLAAANVLMQCERCDAIVSGGGDSAAVMAEQLRQLGIASDRIAVDTGSRTTAESAAHLADELAGQSVFLVTSAGHMRRAVKSFRNKGISSIPVPTDHRYAPQPTLIDWGPSPFNLESSDLAVHEYLGLIWYRLSGQA